MISGYDIGTEVKWNDNGTLTRGKVEVVYRQPTEIDLGGERVRVAVSSNSPTYLIRHHDGSACLMAHKDVFLKRFNPHT